MRDHVLDPADANDAHCIGGDDFDFGDVTSLDDVNVLLHYYQIYSSATPMDVDDPSPPTVEFAKWLKEVQDSVGKLPINEVERREGAGDLEMMVELVFGTPFVFPSYICL